MSESIFLKRVWAYFSGKGVKLFRNNTGVAYRVYEGKKIPIHYGLHTGSADLIGWTTVTVTPEMVGRKLAVFTSIETKSKNGVVSPDQINWDKRVREAGGYSYILFEGQDIENIK